MGGRRYGIAPKWFAFCLEVTQTLVSHQVSSRHDMTTTGLRFDVSNDTTPIRFGSVDDGLDETSALGEHNHFCSHQIAVNS